MLLKATCLIGVKKELWPPLGTLLCSLSGQNEQKTSQNELIMNQMCLLLLLVLTEATD